MTIMRKYYEKIQKCNELAGEEKTEYKSIHNLLYMHISDLKVTTLGKKTSKFIIFYTD